MSTDRLDVDTGPMEPVARELRLHYSAISDVGRVRKDNQDSGYAGPWLLTVCDGVGGAARGDVASSTAVTHLRALDVEPPPDDVPPLLDRVSNALHDAHVGIGRLVDEHPALNGTSTTATVALFDGSRLGLGHVGDSRAYLYRSGEISQLTVDHTFVQSLIDEGRITPAEARVHPHRNLILKALDGVHEAEPDLFVLEVVPGDRLFLCSDGACGVLDDGRLADILSFGTPDYAAVELVRASLEAGSSDNVTCLVADVVDAAEAMLDQSFLELEPLVVGAAAEMPRMDPTAGAARSLFRGHRSGDTGELDAVDAPLPEEVPFAIPKDPLPLDPEAARYAPRAPERFVWARRLLVLLGVLGLLWVAGAGAYSFSQSQYYIGQQDGAVVIFRGVDVDVPGVTTRRVVESTDLTMADLDEHDQGLVADGIPAEDLTDAEAKLREVASHRTDQSTDTTSSGTSATATATPSPGTPGASGTAGGTATAEPSSVATSSPAQTPAAG